MATRYNINDFALANPAYAGGTVSFWTVSGGAKTATLATLYAAATGSTTLTNPRALDSDGKFAVPVYVEVPVIATVSGLTVADHDTGIMGLAEVAASASATAAAVSAAAALVSQSAAGVSAAAALVSENNAAATLANALLKTGGTMTGDLTMGVGKVVIFEGATDDAFETTLTVVDPTADRTLTLPNATDTLVGKATTDTLTNKRVTPRVGSTTSHATPTINTDNVDIYKITAQTEAITSMTTNLSGTPTDGDVLIIQITGTAARAITWGASFEASTVALPATTVTTAMLSVGFLWNTATSKWRCMAAV